MQKYKVKKKIKKIKKKERCKKIITSQDYAIYCP